MIFRGRTLVAHSRRIRRMKDSSRTSKTRMPLFFRKPTRITLLKYAKWMKINPEESANTSKPWKLQEINLMRRWKLFSTITIAICCPSEWSKNKKIKPTAKISKILKERTPRNLLISRAKTVMPLRTWRGSILRKSNRQSKSSPPWNLNCKMKKSSWGLKKTKISNNLRTIWMTKDRNSRRP